MELIGKWTNVVMKTQSSSIRSKDTEGMRRSCKDWSLVIVSSTFKVFGPPEAPRETAEHFNNVFFDLEMSKTTEDEMQYTSPQNILWHRSITVCQRIVQHRGRTHAVMSPCSSWSRHRLRERHAEDAQEEVVNSTGLQNTSVLYDTAMFTRAHYKNMMSGNIACDRANVTVAEDNFSGCIEQSNAKQRASRKISYRRKDNRSWEPNPLRYPDNRPGRQQSVLKVNTASSDRESTVQFARQVPQPSHREQVIDGFLRATEDDLECDACGNFIYHAAVLCRSGENPTSWRQPASTTETKRFKSTWRFCRIVVTSVIKTRIFRGAYQTHLKNGLWTSRPRRRRNCAELPLKKSEKTQKQEYHLHERIRPLWLGPLVSPKHRKWCVREDYVIEADRVLPGAA